MNMSRLLAIAALPLAFLVQPAFAQEHTLKIASATTNDVIFRWMETFKAAVEERSEGRIAVELYPANQLGQTPDTIEGVAFGTIEVTFPASGFFVTMDPRFEVFDVPGVFRDFQHAQRVASDPEVLARISTYGNSQGLVPIAAVPHGPLGVLTINGVRSVEEFSGQRIRTTGPTPLHVEPLQALGALPLSMPLGEVPAAMQNRVIDGLFASVSIFTTGRYYDVAKPMTLLPESYVFATAVASQAFFDNIGPELEALVREEALAAATVANEWNNGALEQTFGTWKEAGGELHTFDEESTERYLQTIEGLMPTIAKANPALEAEIDFIRAAAERLAE